MPTCLIALGANLGDRCAALDGAIARLEREPRVRVLRCSRWRETMPVGGPGGQGPFLNGAAMLETSLPPETLLEILLRIEDDLGRRREFRTLLPEVPLSYDGLIVKICWCARLRLFLARGRQHVVEDCFQLGQVASPVPTDAAAEQRSAAEE